MALKRTWIASPNYRAGRPSTRLIVLHTAEGSRTYQSLGNYFKGRVSASSHVGIDDTRGTIGEYVSRGNTAWTQAAYNSVALSAELCGFASWSRATWLNSHKNMLLNTADWIAEEAKRYGIPIQALTNAQAQGSGRGVCQHSQLGAAGGGHTDCGPGFPMAEVIAWAKGTNPGPVPPPPPPKPGQPAPAFPYPSNHYIGTPRPDPACHSGCYGGPDKTNCQRWQQRMRDRGWNISVDGCFGPQSKGVAIGFQREKGLAVDGLIGPRSWAAAWTAPVT